MKGRVLVVDDEKNITVVLQAMLERAEYETIAVDQPREALKLIEDEEFDVIITDLTMPEVDGFEILRHAQKLHPETPVVMITAYGTVESAVNALKNGAFDFISKPFDQADLLSITAKATETCLRRRAELNYSGREISALVGQSAPLQEIFKVITKVAKSPSAVLISGERGTGKELVAFEIHRLSDRASKPFIKINCAAIPPAQLEGELFGQAQGATGPKMGRFELAHEGTLFLDEVSELPIEMQVRVLRVLQDQTLERVDGVSPIRIDVRVIAATHRDLAQEAKLGKFRDDLLYKLSVVPIFLPPLKSRPEDIESLAKFFISQLNQRLKKAITGLEPATLSALKRYAWPGNIRQLENVLERMMLMAEGLLLTTRDLPDDIPSGQTTGDANLLTDFKEVVRRKTQSVERDLIEKALLDTHGNVTKAAEKLGLSRKGLQLKMKEVGVRRGG